MDYSRLRLPLPGRPETELTDQLSGERPAVWDGDDLDIEFWLGSECARDEPVDLTLVESITMEFRLTDSTAGLLIAQQEILVADMEECTLEEWMEDEGQHGTFTLTAAQMNFANSVRRFWASFQVNFVNGYVRTMGAGYISVAQSLHGASGDPPGDAISGYLFITSSTPDGDGMYPVSFRGKTGRIVIYDVTP